MTQARTAVLDMPALGWSYQTVLDDKGRRTLVAQVHLPCDASLAQINKMLDKIARASDRQAAYYELEDAERELQLHIDKLREMEAQLVNMDEKAAFHWRASGKHGDWDASKLSPNEQGARKNIEASRIRYREGAEQLQKRIAHLKGKMNAADVGATGDAGEP